MRLLYALGARGNLLYEGKFELGGRYQTYGQHSYVYDFLACARRRGLDIDLAVRGLDRFPLRAPLARHCAVFDYDAPGRHPAEDYDGTLLDEPGEDMMPGPRRGLTACIVHNARRIYPASYVRAVDVFVCMSESAVARQSQYIDPAKLVLIPQGVDLCRFQPRRLAAVPGAAPRVLVYSRLDGLKAATVTAVVERLAAAGADLTVLGDGEQFWPISDSLGSRITLVNFIPCHSIHNFLHQFDVVVSSGRGVMEALASGIPAICAGLGYGGPVLPENVERLLKANLTGYQAGDVPADLSADVAAALSLDPAACRAMAEARFDVETSVSRVTRLMADGR
jgi:glycosyltransferase involved in cell wall biosynthesis